MKDSMKLTELEIKIMKVLWEHDREMTIQEIAACLEDERISLPSVKQSVRHLLNKKAVMVCESVLVVSVYARTFRACFSQEEFLASEYKRLQKSVYGKRKKSIASVAVAMLCDSEEESVSREEIERLQNYINAKKEQLRETKE